MIARIANLVVKDLRQLRRDRLLVLFIVFGPVLELVMVASSTSAGIHNLPTVVVDRDGSRESRRLTSALSVVDTFALQAPPGRPGDLGALFDKDEIAVAFVIPQGFGVRSATGREAEVLVIVDGTEPAAAEAALAAAEGVVADVGGRIAPSRVDARGDFAAVEPRVRIRYNESLKDALYTVPSEMGFMLAAVTAMVASLGIARERELGTLEQLLVTPLREFEMVIGKAVPAILLAYAVFLLMLAISIGMFGIPMRGSWPLLLGLAAGYLFVELGWGIMVSAVSKTQLQALLLVFVVIMVQTVFSGYAFPVENMPRPLQLVANLFPIKHWLIVLRSIMLKGAGVAAFWQELVALAFLGTAINASTVLLLRRQRLG